MSLSVPEPVSNGLPDALTPGFVLTLLETPPRAGALGSAARRSAYGDDVRVRAVQTESPDIARTIEVRDDEQYVQLLFSLAGEPDIVVAPYTTEPEGTRRLWAIAAARLVLAPTARVEAHHVEVFLDAERSGHDVGLRREHPAVLEHLAMERARPPRRLAPLMQRAVAA